MHLRLMRTSTLIWILLVALLLGVIWWVTSSESSNNSATTTTPADSPDVNNQNPAQAAVPIVLSTATSTTLGNYLVATNQMTLYRYDKDVLGGAPTCTDACASIWPPYIIADAKQPLLPGAGISGNLNVIIRADGRRQLTYKGMPLYYYRNDARPGDTTGQGVANLWHVVAP